MKKKDRFTGVMLFATVWLLAGNSPSFAGDQQWYVSYMSHGAGDHHEHTHYSRAWQKESGVDAAKPGMYELTQYPVETQPTPEQKKTADELVRRSYQVAKDKGWFDYDQGIKDGFVQFDETHYENEKFIHDGKVLDPERPEYLMYYDTSGGKKLAGFMFLTNDQYEHGPQVGGPLTVWHYHIWDEPQCIHGSSGGTRPVGKDCLCPTAELSKKSREMMHVWFVDHPDGPFATGMTLPEELILKLKAK